MDVLWILLVYCVDVQMTQGEIVNLALNKPAEMNSIYTGNPNVNYSAANAVDGNINTVSPNIIHTGTVQRLAWWKVDLETVVQGATVKIYFRTENGNINRRKVQLYTSTTPFSSYPGNVSQSCYTYTSTLPDVLTVSCTRTWQYLLVYNSKDGGPGPILDFAEVEVLVSSADMEHEDKQTAQFCSIGTYGTNCSKPCGTRQCAETPTSCDRYTGECPSGGCKAGWMGPDCIQVCTTGTYGSNCDNTCASRNCVELSTSCHHISGACSAAGCTAGYQGTDCTQVCTSETYGDKCTNNCASRQCAVTPTSCNHITGACTPGGCNAGWKGVDCFQVCSNDTYGKNCNKSCASRPCAVKASPCDRYNGACASGGCDAGWHGIDCMERCTVGTYGHGCTMSCERRQCTNPSFDCDHVTGQCVSGCNTGWNGTDCTQMCSAGTYGDDCNNLCNRRHCEISSETCDHVTGRCPNGCGPGWNGTDCTTECPNGTYGANCMMNCNDRHCRTSYSPCDHETGQCPDGCLDGWRGSDCTSNETETTTQVSVDDTGNSSQNQTAVVAGTVSAVVVGILLLIIVGVIIWRRKREGSRRKETCEHVYYNTATPGVKVMEPGSKVCPKKSLPDGDEEGHIYTTIDQGCSPGNPELMDKSKPINSVRGPDDYEPVMGRTYEKLSMSNDQGSEYTELERKYENIKTKNI